MNIFKSCYLIYTLNRKNRKLIHQIVTNHLNADSKDLFLTYKLTYSDINVIYTIKKYNDEFKYTIACEKHKTIFYNKIIFHMCNSNCISYGRFSSCSTKSMAFLCGEQRTFEFKVYFYKKTYWLIRKHINYALITRKREAQKIKIKNLQREFDALLNLV